MTFSKGIQEHLRDEKEKRNGGGLATSPIPKAAPAVEKISTPAAHGVCTIQSTNQYDLFKQLDTNRKVDRTHVAKLVRAIRSKNLLHLNPIVVDGEMNIIDGQHRLQAAKQLRVPIYYTKDSKVSQDDIASMNSNKKNWTLTDYINFYVNKGVPDFVKFDNLRKKYPETPIALLMVICSAGGKRNGNLAREGELDITNIENADTIMQQLGDYKQYTDQAESARFIEAFIFLNNSGQYDHERMMGKVAANPTAIVPCANKKQYIQLLQTIYNKGVREQNIVLFLKR